MKLESQEKLILLAAVKKIYQAYLALDFFKSYGFKTDAGDLTLFALCKQALKDKIYQHELVIEGLHYELLITAKNKNTCVVTLERLIQAPSNTPVRLYDEYSINEILSLLAAQRWIVQHNDNKTQYHAANEIDHRFLLGGEGKYNLYRKHLVTLFRIAKRLETEEELSSWLVALPKGWGKTSLQALWMIVLWTANMHGVFAIPAESMEQYLQKIQRLAPSQLMDSLCVFDHSLSLETQHTLLKSLRYPTTRGTLVVGSGTLLMKQHAVLLQELPAYRTLLVWADASILQEQSGYLECIAPLAKQKYCLFLTASPNPALLTWAANKPVTILSQSYQNQTHQGSFPRLVKWEAPTLSDRDALTHYRFWTKEFWRKQQYRFFLMPNQVLEKETPFLATSALDELLYYHFDKANEQQVRWRMQVPAARKILCVVDDHETLMTLYYTLLYKNLDKKVGYSKGRFIEGGGIAQWLDLSEVESAILHENREAKRKDYQDTLKEDEKPVDITRYARSMKEQLSYTLWHQCLEYVLQDITGLESMALNKKRQANFPKLCQRILTQFILRDAVYYQNLLEVLIDEKGAQEISVLLAEFSQVMKQAIHHSDKKNFYALVDNWFLNYELVDWLTQKYPGLATRFEHYAKRHLILSVVNAMSDAKTPIEDNKPFRQFKLHDESQAIDQKSEFSGLERFNKSDKEIFFIPDYWSITEEQADNYFRLGFVGLYVSNKKSGTFHDVNLHTVLHLTKNNLSSSSHPHHLIQCIGLNQGLDDSIEPVYIHAASKKQTPLFEISLLAKEDYYPALFKAQEQYEAGRLQVLGHAVTQKITTWINAQLEKKVLISTEQLSHQIDYYLMEAVQDLGSKASKVTKEQLKELTGLIIDNLKKEQAILNNPYPLSWPFRVLNAVFYGLSLGYQMLKRFSSGLRFYYNTWFLPKSALTPHDLYLKILSHTHYEKLIAALPGLWELKNWADKIKQNILLEWAEQNYYCLKQEVAAAFAKHYTDTIEPLLIINIVDEKKEQVISALTQFPQAVAYFYNQFPLLERVMHSTSIKVFKEGLLSLLHPIPGLEELEASDLLGAIEGKTDIETLFSSPLSSFFATHPEGSQAAILRLSLYLNRLFIPNLSLLINYPSATILQECLSNESNVKRFATHWISKWTQGMPCSTEFFIQELHAFFNLAPVKLLPQHMEWIAATIKTMKQEVDGQLQSLEKDRIVHLSRESLLPFLAGYLKSDSMKAHFLHTAVDKEFIYQWFLCNAEGLEQLPSQKETDRRHAIVQWLNQLDETIYYRPYDLHEAMTAAQQAADSCMYHIRAKMILSFLGSNSFRHALQRTFNRKDYKALLRVLSVDSSLYPLANQLAKEEVKSLKWNDVMVLLKKNHPHLSVVCSLEERFKEVGIFWQNCHTRSEKYLDPKRITAMLEHHLEPLLIHPHLLTSLKQILGFLEEEELTALFEMMNITDAAAEAKKSLRWLALVKDKNIQVLVKELIYGLGFESLDLDVLRLVREVDFNLFQEVDKQEVAHRSIWKTIVLLVTLFEEFMDCQCAANRHNRTGGLDHIPTPQIHSFLTAKSTQWTHPLDTSAINGWAQKTRYFHALLQGLATANLIHGQTRYDKIKALQQAQEKVLTPLWWQTSVSLLYHALHQTGSRGIESLLSLGQSLIKTMETLMKQEWYKFRFRIKNTTDSVQLQNAIQTKVQPQTIVVNNNRRPLTAFFDQNPIRKQAVSMEEAYLSEEDDRLRAHHGLP